jgi:hypothetical protein
MFVSSPLRIGQPTAYIIYHFQSVFAPPLHHLLSPPLPPLASSITPIINSNLEWGQPGIFAPFQMTEYIKDGGQSESEAKHAIQP